VPAIGILPGQCKKDGQQNAALHIFDRPDIATRQARSGFHAILLMQRKRKLAKKNRPAAANCAYAQQK
jgi:hypothetical protein